MKNFDVKAFAIDKVGDNHVELKIEVDMEKYNLEQEREIKDTVSGYVGADCVLDIVYVDHFEPLKSKSEIKEWITGFDKPMNFDEMKRFVDCIQYDNGWGTLMIRSWRTEMMTPEALADLEKTIQYARQQGVEIVSLREGLKRFARD